MTDDIPVHSGVSPSAHPGTIKGDTPGPILARKAMGALYEAEGKVRDMHATIHDKSVVHQRQIMAAMPKSKTGVQAVAPPLMYDRAAADLVIENGTSLAQSALKTADSTLSTLGETVDRLDAQIDGKITAEDVGKAFHVAFLGWVEGKPGSNRYRDFSVIELTERSAEGLEPVGAAVGGPPDDQPDSLIDQQASGELHSAADRDHYAPKDDGSGF